MDKTIIIDGKPVVFRKTAGTSRRYQMQFGREFMEDLNKMLALRGLISEVNDEEKDDEAKKAAEEKKVAAVLGFETSWMYDLAYIMAQQADPSIKDELSWLDSFDEMNIFEIIQELVPMLIAEAKPSLKNV
ncbi:MAG: hypothetical protein J6S92_06850 [Oscillospiraceae bacterium]|nr:hypothetical protein [Bacteroidaceae bacterium]MBP0987981.1 hypothetical protein [Oscillospiraceae bacterium]